MAPLFAPAYVFVYSARTRETIRRSRDTPGKCGLIDAQNSAPPFDRIETQAWASHDGALFIFENGSPAALVKIDHDAVARQLTRKS